MLHDLWPNRTIVAVTEGLKSQESLHQDLGTWLEIQSKVQSPKSKVQSPTSKARRLTPNVHSPQSTVQTPQSTDGYAQETALFYAAWEVLPHEGRLPHADVLSERLETLVALSAGREGDQPRGFIVVTSVVALLQRTFPAQSFRTRIRRVARGDRLEPLDLADWLEQEGYEPEAQVTQKGHFALRGGILDLYPLTSPWPVRLEFFGDEVESLRQFDPLTQISRDAIESVWLPPAGELGMLKRARESENPVKTDSAARAGEVQEAPTAVRDENVQDGAPPSRGPQEPGTLLDYLESDTIFLFCEPQELDERAQVYEAQLPVGEVLHVRWEVVREEIQSRGMSLIHVAEAETDPSSNQNTLRLPSLDAFRPLSDRAPELPVAEAARGEFFAQLHRWLRQNYVVHVFCNNEGERQRFTEIWAEYGLSPTDGAPESASLPKPPQPELHLGTLARGFLFAEAQLVVVTDAEIFGRYRVQRPRRLKSPHAQAARSALDIDFSELEEGDYVVHLQHGIGRYLGLQVLPTGLGGRLSADEPDAQSAESARASDQECLVLEFAPSDPSQAPPKLYVPVTEAHLVSKYVGTGKVRPPLNTLGGTRWAKTKAQAALAVRDVAGDLLSIQAARAMQPGHAFAADTAWQREFESAFIYEATPDQDRAIAETKMDMERPKPMDRLICGDVGFGKTEVAIRAAFKAVMDGKQVAVLVPTTVLAQQHFNTFGERMADYPVRLELLSRFRTRRQQQRVVRDLAAGSVDIVIGTHRLLQSDIIFKDLGLVVVDEEQRFGVMHKEKLKRLRQLVDVLTLSATPIPRTLYLALTGARDMSTIQTPPQDRLPVETIIAAYDERLIRDSIQRELNRGGQVFFLHNRVVTIQVMAQKLQTLLPQARIVVGHGQMHSDELEETMTCFVNGEADVLLSTTIIESGLDIPNANTIIIDRADRFGLSDLYQLRGRVGRYKHQAYAYFLLPRHGSLVVDARKRLSAIKQYSTLGSGFKIAMRDLEIRGAGNLLGAQQSGHITAVGFELYCQLLKQSISALKGEKVPPRVEVQMRLDFISLTPGSVQNPQPSVQAHGASVQSNTRPAYAGIPMTYISDARPRIEIYRKLAQATDPTSLTGLEAELRDRFGLIPASLALLLQISDVKIAAASRRITAIEVKEDRLMLTRDGDYVMIGSKFPRLTRTKPEARLKEIKKLISAL
jgi:transcription-repair coupling factor (superfamily II helicase)